MMESLYNRIRSRIESQALEEVRSESHRLRGFHASAPQSDFSDQDLAYVMEIIQLLLSAGGLLARDSASELGHDLLVRFQHMTSELRSMLQRLRTRIGDDAYNEIQIGEFLARMEAFERILGNIATPPSDHPEMSRENLAMSRDVFHALAPPDQSRTSILRSALEPLLGPSKCLFVLLLLVAHCVFF